MKIRLNMSASNILKWMLSILLILDVNSVFYNLYNVNLHLSEFTCVIVAIIAVNYFVFCRKSVSRSTLQFIILYLILAFIFASVSVESDSYIAYGVKFYFFIPCMILLYVSDEELGIDIIKKSSEFTCLLALLSLIMYFLYYFIPSFGTITIEWGSVSQVSNYIFFFAGQEQEIAGTHVMRNTGIFCEAPMYGFVLIMALSTQLFYYKTRNRFKIMILVVTIASTLSVSAIAMAIILFGIRYFVDDSVRDNDINTIVMAHRGQFKYFIGLFAVIVASIAIYYLFQFKVNTGLSLSKRLDDYIAGFVTWKSNPLFGAGYDNHDAIVENMAAWRIKYTEPGYSNSWMSILATCGICGFLLYLISFVKMMRNSIKAKDIFMAVQIFILILQMFTTTLAFHLYILNYVALGFSYKSQSGKRM